MKRMQTLMIVLVGAAALAFAGCDSDDNGGTGGTGGATGNTGGATGNTGGGTGGGGPDASGDVGGDEGGGGAPAATGACTNDADLAIINGDEVDVTAEASSCGLGCIGGAESCAKDCVVTNTGVTDGCADCFANLINCSIENCVSECLADTESQACVCCRENNCNGDFYGEACSGLENSNPPEGC